MTGDRRERVQRLLDQLAARPRRNTNPIQQYALRLAFAELGAVDASLQPLGFEQAMADSRWCLVIIERARKFQS